MNESWGDFTFEEPHTFKNKFLDLPNGIMENICRYLTTRDQYNACLIHPNWTTAAQTVLWEKPRFETPASFRDFMNTIRSVRKVSLLVHDIYLVFLDHQVSIFQPIVKSNTERHGLDSNALSSLNFLGFISKTCENLKSLSFYGWHIDPSWVEKLGLLAPELTSLYIIGGNVKSTSPLALSGLLNRLTSLRLDGVFNIDDKWAEVLVTRSKMIQQLQFSLRNMQVSTLRKICSPNGLTSLCDLTLTDAIHLTDQHVESVVTSFPYLQKLCLEGTVHVTILSIALILDNCPELTSLEIRALFKTLDHPLSGETVSAFNDLMMYNQSCATPFRFLLENLNIDDDHLSTLAPHLHVVRTLGFKSCPLITSEGLKSAVESMKWLRTVHILNCMNIDSGFFLKFASMGNIIKSLYRVHFESSGAINPRHVYDFCRAGIEYNLRQIRFVGYYDLQSSAIGNFNEELDSKRLEDQSIVTLNRTSMDALTLSNDPEFSSVPIGRFLTGKQIVKLAKNLDISVEVLLDKMTSSCDSDDEDGDGFYTEEEDYNIPRNRKAISFSNLAESDKPSNSRQFALKHQNSSQRPTTPALWSNDLEKNNVIYGDESGSEKSSNDETSGFTEEENTDEYVDDDEVEEKEEEEEEEEETPSPKWATLGSASGPNTGSEISLGGWGVTSNEGWVTTSKPHSSEQSTIPPVVPHAPTPLTQTQQQSQPTTWTGYREEVYKDQWNQTGLEVNPKSLFTVKQKQKHFRNSPLVSDNDGWGSAQAVIPWDDVRAQGYVKSVIEEQKNTTFWTQDDHGKWKMANDPAPKTTITTTKQVIDRNVDSAPTSANNSAPILFSDIASKLHNSRANASIPITQSQRGKSSHPNHHVNRPPPISTPSRLRSDSLISSDGSVAWNEESNTHVKLSNKEPTPSHIVTPTTSTPRFSTPKASDSSARSKWSSAEEWKNIKESNNDTTSTEQSSWQDNFSPAAIADKTAKNEWKNFSRPRTSTPTRSNYPAREVDSRWGAFSNSNNVSPPPRNSTSSPPRAANAVKTQKPATPTSATAAPVSDFQLIDTTNLNATPSRPILKGDVWESISSLDIPTTSSAQHAVLVPQGATATMQSSVSIPTEIGDWSPLGSDSSKEQDTFRFQETIVGTVTEQEVLDEAETRKNDNLVDFEDLISSSAPVISPNFSNSVLASPLPSNRNIASDLLNMEQIDTTTASIPAHANTTITPDIAADPAKTASTVTSPALSTPIHDFASLMPDYKPAEKAATPEPGASSNTPNYTNASPSVTKEEAEYTLNASTRSTPETNEKKPSLIKLRVQIENEGTVQLALNGVSYFFIHSISNVFSNALFI
ncbi:unnamed protein product [Mucor hiemalis]